MAGLGDGSLPAGCQQEAERHQQEASSLPLSNTPRVYLFPAGADVLRSPDPFNFKTREWQVIDQVLPVPFPIGSNDLETDNWLPMIVNLGFVLRWRNN